MSGQAELVQELKILRKGRGLQGRIEERVGPFLRSACAVSEEDGLVAIRTKVAGRLTELASHLPDDLRQVALAAFAISSEAHQPLYQDRVRWAAMRVDRDPRTVRRRVDEAIDLLAELASGSLDTRTVSHSDSWHTTSLAVAMVLDQPPPSVLERRQVVADQDGVRSLDLAVSFPAGCQDLSVTVFYGGTLVDQGMESTDRWGYSLELPRPLSRGETWEVAVLFRPAVLLPCIVCVPKHACDLFDLRVRFGPDRPREVRALDGAFQRDVSDPGYEGRRHEVDPVGELHMRFQHLTPGMAYGARWTDQP